MQAVAFRLSTQRGSRASVADSSWSTRVAVGWTKWFSCVADEKMVRPAGFGPAAPGLGNRHGTRVTFGTAKACASCKTSGVRGGVRNGLAEDKTNMYNVSHSRPPILAPERMARPKDAH